MRIEQRDGYRVIVGGPVPPQADAITLGKTILMRAHVEGSDDLLAHELVHVRQFREMGPVRFLAKYVGSYLRFRLNGYGHMAAYRRIPLEVEASWLSRLHQSCDLEPAATELKDRFAPRPGNRPVRAPRTTPSGTWIRSRSARAPRAPRTDLGTVKAAMASRPTQ